jgi:hypothetical protein
LNFDFDFIYPKNVDVYIALGDLQTSLYKVVQQNQAGNIILKEYKFINSSFYSKFGDFRLTKNISLIKF